MSNHDFYAIIVAERENGAMKSKLPTVFHSILGRPVLDYILETLKKAGAKGIFIVIENSDEYNKHLMKDGIQVFERKKQLGAVLSVIMSDYIKGQGHTLVLNGITPMLTAQSLAGALQFSAERNLEAVVLQSKVADGGIAAIFKSSPLESLMNDFIAGEPEENWADGIIALFENAGREIYGYSECEDELMSADNRIKLAYITKLMQKKINANLMLGGVTIIDPDTTYIAGGVKIGMDTIVYPGASIEGETVIGENCHVGMNSKINNMTIGNHVHIESSVLNDSEIGDYTMVGPFAYVRPGSKIGTHCKIGDFVEIKNAVIGDHTKASHLTYLGDADIGKNINFGCGTVTVNYDGKRKFRTVIEDNAFIGCNSNLIAPVTVKEGAYVAAGSTITDEVPKNSLAVARARQIVKANWADKRNH